MLMDESSAIETRVAIGDDGTRLYVRGAKGDITLPAFVLVHGLSSNARLWDGVLEGLMVTDHTAYAVDLRGHGQSEKPERGYDFETMASDVAAVVRDVIARRAILVGQSWGGNVVLETAARFPEVAKAVVCVDGGFIRLSDRYDSWSAAAGALRPPQRPWLTVSELEQLAPIWFDDFPAEGIRGQLANFKLNDDETVEPHLSLVRHMTILRHLYEHNPDETAAHVDVPVRILAVEDDRAKRSRVSTFAGHLHDGMVVWSNGHHDIHAQRPSEVVDLLLDLSAQVSP